MYVYTCATGVVRCDFSRRRFLAAAVATNAASRVASAASLNFVKSPLSTNEKQSSYQLITASPPMDCYSVRLAPAGTSRNGTDCHRR